MNSNIPSSHLNFEGYNDFVAANMLKLSTTEFVDWLWYYLEYHIPKTNGLGQLKRLNKKQYIRDKLELLKDEFLCPITYEDVRHVVVDSWSFDDVDRTCRDILLRHFEHMEE